MRGLLVSGTSSSVGKTTIALAIMAGPRQRGLAVQPFKCGPDFLDAGQANVLASHIHLHFRANPVVAENFVATVPQARSVQRVTA